MDRVADEPRVRRLSKRVLETSSPPEGAIYELLLPTNPTLVVCFGLLQHSRRLLESVISLMDQGFGDTTSGAIRSIFEDAITGGWLLLDDEDRTPLTSFLGTQRKHVRQSVDESDLPSEFLDHYDALMTEWA